MLSYFHQYEPLLKWLGIISVITFVVSILLIPWLIGLLPQDYFIGKKESFHASRSLRLAFSFLFVLMRNVLGAVLLLAGIAMLFLPGQGILTMVLGLSMLDFPKKHLLIQNLTRRPAIRQGLNWIRAKTNRPPFLWTHEN